MASDDIMMTIDGIMILMIILACLFLCILFLIFLMSLYFYGKLKAIEDRCISGCIRKTAKKTTRGKIKNSVPLMVTEVSETFKNPKFK